MSASFRAAVAFSLATTSALLGIDSAQAKPQPGPIPRNLQTTVIEPRRAAPSAVAALTAGGRYANQAFAARAALVDQATGKRHVRLNRSFRGLPVRGGSVIVHQGANGKVEGVTETLGQRLAPRTQATISATQAAATVEANLAASLRKSGAAPKLVIDALHGGPRLAWEITSRGRHDDGTPSRLVTWVDAASGAIRGSEQQIKTVDGTGNGYYSGRVAIGTTPSSWRYQLKDPARGNNYTTDMRGVAEGWSCSSLGLGCYAGSLMTDFDNSWGNGTRFDRDSVAVDAHYGTATTWDFYKSTFGRNGIRNDGKGTYNRVHYGVGYSNAFWDGVRMTYGDGDRFTYGPFASLDIAGHEMTHGVIDSTAKLNYSGESGGLNESFSDVMGTGVEFFANNSNDRGDFLLGERVTNSGTGLRRMDNPESDGKSANCWSSAVGDLNVHNSSGVGNHAFYLMSMGSGAKTLNGVSYNSPTCNGSSVSAIGMQSALQVWYRALTTYMTDSTNYSQARTAMIRAAEDLYGANSDQVHGVAAAWSAVNVK